jgi:hypothetical protein
MQTRGNGFAWSVDTEEEENRVLGPEDYAWAASLYDRPEAAPVPDLEWVWDSSPSDLIAFQLSVALLQPLGSA